jgi:hypothetical protein
LPFFSIDPSNRQTYREDLAGAIAHPLRSRTRRGALQLPPSGQRCSFLYNNLIDRATPRSRDERVGLTSRVLLSASRPHLRSTYIGVPAPGRHA